MLIIAISLRRLIAALGFLAVSGLVGAVYGAVGVRKGWRLWPTLVSSIALAFIVAVTLTPTEFGEERTVQCIFTMPTTLGLLELPHLNQESLNALLLLPFGFFNTLAARRTWLAVLPVLVTPLLIELIQALVPALVRVCNLQDIADNITGGLAGVLLGALVMAAVQWRRGSG